MERLKRPVGDRQRVGQILAARLPQRGVEPKKEPPLCAQRGDALALGGTEPVQDAWLVRAQTTRRLCGPSSRSSRARSTASLRLWTLSLA